MRKGRPEPRHKSLFMYHPGGPEFEEVRTFPPVVVPSKRSESDDLFVYTEYYGTSWKRKKVAHGADYPNCFIAWDADEGEWAVHQPGEVSVEEEYDPVDLPQPDQPSMDLIQPEVRGIFEPKRKRRSLREWFLSLSDSNETPDFLRHKESS